MSMARDTGAVAVQTSLFEEVRGRSADKVSVGVEAGFDVPLVAELALKEKQIQQNVRPVIAVHKWFARRPGTLFRALLLAEFASPPLRESFFRPHQLDGLTIADPFMGGGTPLLEANRLGCDVVGWDINPMAWWIVRQEIEHLDLETYQTAAEQIGAALAEEVGGLYRTRCEVCDREEADVKYFLWVKTLSCTGCGHPVDCSPGYLVAAKGRHPCDVVCCAACGALTEVADHRQPGRCQQCSEPLRLEGNARRGRCTCPRCQTVNTYPRPDLGPPRHRLIAIEYHCDGCQPRRRGRFFKAPDAADLERLVQAERRYRALGARYVPDEPIPAGDETTRLHRWGYSSYDQMFNSRQRLGLETLCRLIVKRRNQRVRSALATNLSDLLRYQNMLCRYDTTALKSLDVFSVHGFPVGLVQCESNLLGLRHRITGANIGSGGWANVVDKFIRAKKYCEQPFELAYSQRTKTTVMMDGEWIGNHRPGSPSRRVDLRCESATEARRPRASLDAVLTDPPYFANVQYAELMDFCYVWLRRLVGATDPIFKQLTTRNPDELTGNATMARGLDHFTAGLAAVFSRMVEALKPGRPFVFTYHHNSIDAYYPIAVAMLESGLVCSASLPCPGEMGGSIHIHQTNSSIIDTVFVCRTTGSCPRRSLVGDAGGVADLVIGDLERLKQGGVRVTKGDARCITFGHLIRLAVWKLRGEWKEDVSWAEKLARVGGVVDRLGVKGEIESYVEVAFDLPTQRVSWVRETAGKMYGDPDDEVFF
ncbi:MAG: DUF1156 domain-containing protein [Thermoanaerobaculia bacterium]|nr:DUF1156 domain-containing protein [Thermoanaerobaculia bacterium]